MNIFSGASGYPAIGGAPLGAFGNGSTSAFPPADLPDSATLLPSFGGVPGYSAQNNMGKGIMLDLVRCARFCGCVGAGGSLTLGRLAGRQCVVGVPWQPLHAAGVERDERPGQEGPHHDVQRSVAIHRTPLGGSTCLSDTRARTGLTAGDVHDDYMNLFFVHRHGEMFDQAPVPHLHVGALNFILARNAYSPELKLDEYQIRETVKWCGVAQKVAPTASMVSLDQLGRQVRTRPRPEHDCPWH